MQPPNIKVTLSWSPEKWWGFNISHHLASVKPQVSLAEPGPPIFLQDCTCKRNSLVISSLFVSLQAGKEQNLLLL